MKIRTQLILALFLLAVVPLAGIVLYSYVSSSRAVREAVEQEAAEMTREMEDRVGEIGSDLDRRFRRVGAMPAIWRSLAEESDQRDSAVGMVLSELGEVASLLRSLEFVPAEPPAAEPPPAEPAPGAEAGAGRPPAPAAPPPPAWRPPRAWVIDFDEAMRDLEEEMDGKLPQALRQRILAGLRVGAEETRRFSLQMAKDFELDAAELEAKIEQIGAQLEEDEQQRAQMQVQEHELQSRAAAAHRDYLLHQQESSPGPVEVPVEVEVPIRERGELVGRFRAQLSPGEILYRVLSRTRRDQGEIPFAIDQTGNLITLDDEDRAQLEALPVGDIAGGEPVPADVLSNWVVVTRQEPTSGLTFGIARPIRESLERVRTASARNFGFGMALIGIALIGILPLSRRMTRGLQVVTESAERVARGDLKTRVPVTGRGELGQLANAFNRMAHDLEQNQEKLVEEVRLRHDQEVHQELLEAEYRRKSEELEEARRFQLSLLPRQLPEHPAYEVAVSMRTATEVGGDYYDFRVAPDGTLVAAVGDATGHGASAGTMVTVVKSLFSAHRPEAELGGFLAEANRTVRRMELGRMAMALCLARFADGRMSFASAGMPPALVRRADGRVEELTSPGMPLGGLEGDYRELEVELAAGDLVVLMSDGLPELPNAKGEPLGYERVTRVVAEAPAGEPHAMIDALLDAAERWAGEGPPSDDITFVALKVR